MKQECSGCKFWAGRDSGEGECHRNAPAPRRFIAAQKKSSFVEWPITLNTEWCGEYAEQQ